MIACELTPAVSTYSCGHFNREVVGSLRAQHLLANIPLACLVCAKMRHLSLVQRELLNQTVTAPYFGFPDQEQQCARFHLWLFQT